MRENHVYTSKATVEKVKGPIRRAFLPAEESPVFFGVHSEIAAHYGVDTHIIDPHAATLDYLVAATGG